MKNLWGIDLGGTKIEGVIVEKNALTSPLKRLRVETEASRGYQHIITQVKKLAFQLGTGELNGEPLRIGIAHPGTLDPQTNTIKNSNTTCLNGKPLYDDLRSVLQAEIRMANDANCFALAEACYGAGVGCQTVFGVILGTGVGGGIVINKQPLPGLQGIAGEWGHNVLEDDGPECYCGKRGCVETIISGPALEHYYASLSGEKRSMTDILRRQDDIFASQTLERLTNGFGKAISVVVNILDPDCIVIGGGLSNISALYSEALVALRKNVFNDRLRTVLSMNQLGDSAGVFGAALLWA